MVMDRPIEGLRLAVAVVAFLNLAYFGVEFAVALEIGSVSLFADSIDFLEDTAVNLLILLALLLVVGTVVLLYGSGPLMRGFYGRIVGPLTKRPLSSFIALRLLDHEREPDLRKLTASSFLISASLANPESARKTIRVSGHCCRIRATIRSTSSSAPSAAPNFERRSLAHSRC